MERTYKETLKWLFGLRRFGSKPGLKNIRYLLSRIGDPHERFKSVHVTGTNGKGSTTAMVASILQAEGYKVGRFTSPHLSSFTERIVVNGRQIPPGDVVRIVEEIRPVIGEMVRTPGLRHPTFFEVVTAIAFKYFAEQGVDFASVEVGMGGKLDATNVIHSLVSVITNVSLEHTEVLGKTVLEIAEKKAGIIKEGGVLITATKNDEVYNLFKEVCRERHSRIFRVGRDIRFKKLHSSLEGQSFQLKGLVNDFDELFIPLIGDHQLLNAACAVGAVEALRFHGITISRGAIEEGLRRVRWPGRLEIVQRHPLVVLDCAKDAEAAKAVKEALLKEFTYDRLIAVVSISSDKNIPAMIEQFAQVADLFVITAHKVMGRAAKPSRIAEEVKKQLKPYEIVPDVKEAVRRAMELVGQGDMVIVVGSVFLVGEARELWFRPTVEEPDTPD
ncbi:bifunctional folylpolyglutamate synthase/dihydrofolate synthase [Candidatus Bathyarchaeota archaeon]|nr:bifunctional folylpolyglutamate synthase/dihydrofolate synthase [Candidatus Bathyarchaeota archaeon]